MACTAKCLYANGRRACVLVIVQKGVVVINRAFCCANNYQNCNKMLPTISSLKSGSPCDSQN